MLIVLVLFRKRDDDIQCYKHCVKSVRIRSYSGPHFPVFGLYTERYSISLRIQSKCGQMRTRITPNKDTSSSNFCLIGDIIFHDFTGHFFRKVGENFLSTQQKIIILSKTFVKTCGQSLNIRTQSTDLQSKSMDWFLYDRDLRHERVNPPSHSPQICRKRGLNQKQYLKVCNENFSKLAILT